MVDFSLIIPTYNRPLRLKKCLSSLTNLDYPLDKLEVVIIDDGSPQLLQPIIDEFRQQINLTYFKQKNSGPATARNKGADIAKNKYLVFTDDDCEVDPQWLNSFANILHQYPDAVLGGYTINKLTDNIYSQTSQDLVDYLYSYYNNSHQKSKFFTSNNLVISNSIFNQLNGFDTTFPLAAAEDRELCDRIYDQGYQMIYVPEAIIYHQHFLTLNSFWQQHFNYGKGAKHFHKIKAQKKAGKIKLESINFYSKLLTYPFTKNSNIPQKIQGISLLFISQIANTLGFFISS